MPRSVMEDHRIPLMDLGHVNLPDPLAEAIGFVLKEQDKLEERLRKLDGATGIVAPEEKVSGRYYRSA